MANYFIEIELLSAAVFGRGDGVAGAVDVEAQHDESGLPYLAGRSVKGLLVAQCAEILGAFERQKHTRLSDFKQAADQLFGRPGSDLGSSGSLTFGRAQLPDDLREALQQALKIAPNAFRREDVLAAFSSIRRQTKVDEETGAAADDTLRATRVLSSGLTFRSRLSADPAPAGLAQALLAACVTGARAVGRHRARGLGQCRLHLLDDKGADL
ncbi:MAG: RAMP superfamily CRISPR-associated protein, partial [Thermoflexales bacterium]